MKRDHTKRGQLSVVAPFALPAKMLLQDVCRKGLVWDEHIDGASLHTWQRWLCELERLKEWSAFRCVKSVIRVTARVLTFVKKTKEGNLPVSLIFAKSRVAP